MTNDYWINALLVGDWFLIGAFLIVAAFLIWKFGRRGGRLVVIVGGLFIVCFLIGLFISAVTTRPNFPPDPSPTQSEHTTIKEKI